MNRYYVYIVTDEHREALETGTAGSLSVRLHELSNEIQHNCKYLLYWELHEDPVLAILREREIKKLSRKKKKELIDKSNAQWQFLNETITVYQ
jgi:putative endonuclease